MTESDGIRIVLTLQRKQGFSLDVNLALPGRGVSAIFGESGSGKTSLLRAVAGLERGSGHLHVNGTVWQSDSVFLAPHRRDLGFVFQESSLFDHLTAEQNIRYAMKRARASGRTFDPSFDQIIELMDLGRVLHSIPGQLSGGERQRVAIARALLSRPRLLLMDEPMASLDMARRREILPYLERLHEELDIPILYVSHLLDEVSQLSDYLVVLNGGRVTAQGRLTEVLSQVDPSLDLGDESGVVVEGVIAARDAEWHLLRVSFAGGDLWVRDNGEEIGRSIRVRILARDVSLVKNPQTETSVQNIVPVQVTQVEVDRDEAMSLVRLAAGSDFLVARITRKSVAQLGLAPGVRLTAQIKAAAILR